MDISGIGDKKMAKLDPYGVVVNDVARFQTWRNSQI